MDKSWTPMNGNEHQLVMPKQYLVTTYKEPTTRSYVTWYGSYFLWTALGTRGNKMNGSDVEYFKIRTNSI